MKPRPRQTGTAICDRRLIVAIGTHLERPGVGRFGLKLSLDVQHECADDFQRLVDFFQPGGDLTGHIARPYARPRMPLSWR